MCIQALEFVSCITYIWVQIEIVVHIHRIFVTMACQVFVVVVTL